MTMKATAGTGTQAHWKLDRIHELLDEVPPAGRIPAGRIERIRGLLDGIGDDVDALDRAAYLRIPIPWRRRAA